MTKLYKSKEGTPHTVEVTTTESRLLPYKTKRENVESESDKTVIYKIEGEWRVKYYDDFMAEYDEVKE